MHPADSAVRRWQRSAKGIGGKKSFCFQFSSCEIWERSRYNHSTELRNPSQCMWRLDPAFNQHSSCSDAILHHSEDGEGDGKMGKGVWLTGTRLKTWVWFQWKTESTLEVFLTSPHAQAYLCPFICTHTWTQSICVCIVNNKYIYL